jgi:hypothetical protein
MLQAGIGGVVGASLTPIAAEMLLSAPLLGFGIGLVVTYVVYRQKVDPR